MDPPGSRLGGKATVTPLMRRLIGSSKMDIQRNSRTDYMWVICSVAAYTLGGLMWEGLFGSAISFALLVSATAAVDSQHSGA